MADSVYKFACPACGQRVSATPDLIGSEATCPACAAVFPVPAPPTTPRAKLAALAAQVNALGMGYEPAPDGSDDPEQQAIALERFLSAASALTLLFERMKLVREFVRDPEATELHAIYSEIFRRILAGEWGDTEKELFVLTAQIAPGVRKNQPPQLPEPPRRYMDLDFDCPHCGQHFVASQKLLGTTVDCPLCAQAVELPSQYVFPPAPPRPPEPPPDPEKLSAEVRALGFAFDVPEDMEPLDLAYALDEFLREAEDNFESACQDLEVEDKITFLARPTEHEFKTVGNILLMVILQGEFKGVEMTHKLLRKYAPSLRRR